MQLSFLKKIRVVVSLVFFTSTLFIFVDFAGFFAAKLIRSVLYLQFFPSLIKFTEIAVISAAGFLFVLGVTVLFGRVYCSSVCPLGTLQDLAIWISRKTGIRKRIRYTKPRSFVRYGILVVTIGVMIIGSLFLINILDPYSLAGKIFSDLFRPVYFLGNNLLARILQLFDSYAVYSVEIRVFSWPPLIFTFLFFIFIVMVSMMKGRWYCNVICPAGSLLGLFSKVSLFRIKMDEEACTSCGLCAKACKAGCIDIKKKKVDFSRCIACYDCFGSCPEEGIGYRMALPGWNKKSSRGGREEQTKDAKGADFSRRNFFATTLAGTAAMVLPAASFGKAEEPQGVSEVPVTPPGSHDFWHYTGRCTACHLCVSVCPTKVLQPTFAEYGWSGLFQPKMNFHAEYCNFECVRCSEVCPTGAILPITKEEKETIQIGVSKFIKNICIVVTKKTACGACSEHCPTKAVEMVPYLGKLTIPEVNEKICVGCGACEFACPTKPDKAIYVEANNVHRKAMKPKKKTEGKNKPFNPKDEFPF
jgi:ferredoxin